jgi:hypothetical protein
MCIVILPIVLLDLHGQVAVLTERLEVVLDDRIELRLLALSLQIVHSQLEVLPRLPHLILLHIEHLDNLREITHLELLVVQKITTHIIHVVGLD